MAATDELYAESPPKLKDKIVLSSTPRVLENTHNDNNDIVSENVSDFVNIDTPEIVNLDIDSENVTGGQDQNKQDGAHGKLLSVNSSEPKSEFTKLNVLKTYQKTNMCRKY